MSDAAFLTDKPRDHDPLKETPEVVRSNRSALDGIMQTSFHWADSTVSAGYPRLSVNSPGGMRFLYGPRSQVSNPDRDGVCMLVSDESRVLVFMSGTSYCFGSDRVVMSKPISTYGAQANTQILVDSGFAQLGAAGNYTVTFNRTYGAPPKVRLQVVVSDSGTPGASGKVANYLASVNDITTTNFDVDVEQISASDPSNCTICWYSEGTADIA